MTKNEILEIVIKQVSELNETLPQDQQFNVNEETKLFGINSRIDSLSLVSLIVDLEGTFSSEYSLDISLTDDRAMIREKSPFDSIASLVDYINELINE